MSDISQFKVEIDAPVAWLTLNRPEKRNTMGTTFFKELSEHLENLDRETGVRAVVVKAEGKSFTAGTDLEEAGSHAQEDFKTPGRHNQYRTLQQTGDCCHPQPLHRRGH